MLSSSRPLRLLFVCGGSYVSGAEIVELSVMRGLKARGHTVHCVTNAWNDGDFHARLRAAGIPHTAIRMGAISKSLQPKYLRWTLNALLHLPKAYFDFWRKQRRFEPDLLVFSGARALSTIRPLVDLSKTMLHVHELPGGSLHSRRVMGDRAGDSCRAYVTVSDFVRGRVVEAGAPPARVHTVHNGVAPADSAAVSEALHSFPPEATVIGIVGQIGAWKGHDDLIEALHWLKQQGLEPRCAVIGRGDPAYVDALKEKMRQYGLGDHIAWTGFVNDTEAIYEAIDICVVPSRSEDPFPTTALEAGMRGLPVVATRKGGLPESVADSETGFLVDAESPDQLADRLARLLGDATLRRRMGEAARQRVEERFTLDRMIDDIDRLLRRLHASPA